jgi:hypothetical protein
MLLQPMPYLNGATFADVIFDCACFGFVGLLSISAFAGIVWWLAHGQRRPAPAAPVSIPETLPPAAPTTGAHDDAALAAASRLLEAGHFDAAIAALGDLAARAPSVASVAHLRLGVAWRKKRDFDRAMGHLRRARELGASEADVTLEMEATERARRH